MSQFKAFKYRLYPNEAQEQQLAQFFGAKRWIFNHFLEYQELNRMAEDPHLSHFDMNLIITGYKKQAELTWLKQIDDYCLKHAAEDLSVAYQNFFNSCNGTRKGKKLGRPKFKKKTNRQSYRTNGRYIKIYDNAIKLPKIKEPIKAVIHRKLPDQSIIKTATISKTPTGKYFVSLLVKTEIVPKPMTMKEVGIDLGIKDLIITSDGHKFENPEKQTAKAKRLLKRRQKQLSRKKKGSKNYEKKRIQVAKKYEQITNIRTNYYHNISNWLVSTYDAIYIEDLNISGMLKNRKLARAIHDSAWASLSTMIEYKCSWYGKTYHKINRWFPSSKTCSSCDHKLEHLSLSTRDWLCPSCNTEHDRDINAAKNILHKGQDDLYGAVVSSQATGEQVEIPRALMKFTSKIERSEQFLLVKGWSKSNDLYLLDS